MDPGAARRLLPRFGLAPSPRDRALPALPGSPERCLERRACADNAGRAWLLERLAPAQAPRREQVARLLARLCEADPELARRIPAYRPLAAGAGETFVLRIETGPDAGCWQLSPLVAHAPLPRPGYLNHSWRGEAVARLLLRVQAAGSALDAPPAPCADLEAYALELFASIAAHRPALLPRLQPLRPYLATLPGLIAAQPRVLVHGDLHPLNILWGSGPDEPDLPNQSDQSDQPDQSGDPIRALIDWEFAGTGPALYDAANCLGCAAFEDPSGLSGDFVTGLVGGLALSPVQTRLLAAMLPATRLGWLSEWLRKGDAEMLAMELDYLEILLSLGPDKLAAIWSHC